MDQHGRSSQRGQQAHYDNHCRLGIVLLGDDPGGVAESRKLKEKLKTAHRATERVRRMSKVLILDTTILAGQFDVD